MIRVNIFKVMVAVDLANVTLGMPIPIIAITNMVHQAITIDKTLVLHKVLLLGLKANLHHIEWCHWWTKGQRLEVKG